MTVSDVLQEHCHYVMDKKDQSAYNFSVKDTKRQLREHVFVGSGMNYVQSYYDESSLCQYHLPPQNANSKQGLMRYRLYLHLMSTFEEVPVERVQELISSMDTDGCMIGVVNVRALWYFFVHHMPLSYRPPEFDRHGNLLD